MHTHSHPPTHSYLSVCDGEKSFRHSKCIYVYGLRIAAAFVYDTSIHGHCTII